MAQRKTVTYWGRLTRRLGAEVFDKAVCEKDNLTRPAKGIALLFAQGLSCLILMSPILVAIFGLFIVIYDFPNMITLVIGGILLGAALFLWPKRYVDNKIIYTRNDLPELFSLVDRISSKLGAPKIEGIHIVADYNAYYTEFYKPHKRILGLGMQLWGALSPQERVAIIAHELGHSVNNDPARMKLLAKAFQTLGQWKNILYYDQLDEGIIGIFLSVFYGVVNLILNFLEGVLTRLLFWESQAAEYRADKCAVIIAGPDTCQSLLEKLMLSDLLERHVLTLYPTEQTKGNALLDQMSNAIKDASDVERSNLIREKLLEEHTIDSTHPPTKFRIEYANSFTNLKPRLLLTKEESCKIDRELFFAHEKAGEQLLGEMIQQ